MTDAIHKEWLREYEKQQEESEKQRKKDKEEAEKRQEEAEKRHKELDKELKETGRYIKRLGKLYGGMSRNLGKKAEQFFFNAIKRKMTFAGKNYDFIDKNISRSTRKTEGEFDIVLYNHDNVVLFEVKHHVHPNDLEKLLTKRVADFRELYPEYREHKIYLAIAGMVFDERVSDTAKAAGVAVLKQKGEIVEYDTETMREF